MSDNWSEGLHNYITVDVDKQYLYEALTIDWSNIQWLSPKDRRDDQRWDLYNSNRRSISTNRTYETMWYGNVAGKVECDSCTRTTLMARRQAKKLEANHNWDTQLCQ